MRMFVWIVTALFCGAGVGAITVNIVWQQRIEAENQARIEIFEAEREAARERIEAGIFSDEEADAFIKMLEKFENLYAISAYNYVEYRRQLEVLPPTERNAYIELQKCKRSANAHDIGFQRGLQQGYQQGISAQHSQSYSHQPTQPSQGYSEQTQQQRNRRPNIELKLCMVGGAYFQFYTNGSFTHYDGRTVENGRYEVYDGLTSSSVRVKTTYNNGRVRERSIVYSSGGLISFGSGDEPYRNGCD